MACRGVLVVTHTEGAARASRGHERLGRVQPLRLLGLDEVVDDGVEEGACARSAVQVRTHAGARQRRGCWGEGCWGEGCWGPEWPWPRALGGVEARPGRAGKPRACKPRAGRAPGGQRPGRAGRRTRVTWRPAAMPPMATAQPSILRGAMLSPGSGSGSGWG